MPNSPVTIPKPAVTIDRNTHIYGRNIANPVGQIWAGAMMLDFLTRSAGAGREAHDAILRAIEGVLRDGPKTPDLGGTASTTEMGRAIADRVAQGV